MGGLIATLCAHRLVGIDTAIFIYHIEGNSPFTARASHALEELARGSYLGVTSTLTIMELAVKPLRLGQISMADRYETLLEEISNLTLAEMDRPVVRQAAQLRARHGLRPADVLQVAACLHHGATAFLTNDQRIRRVKECEVVVLEDYLDD